MERIEYRQPGGEPEGSWKGADFLEDYLVLGPGFRAAIDMSRLKGAGLVPEDLLEMEWRWRNGQEEVVGRVASLHERPACGSRLFLIILEDD